MKNRWEIRKLLEERVLLLDGAYGTEFIRMGLEDDKPSESLNLENPDMVYKLQRSYVEAGSDILLTNTFSAIPHKLDELGYGDKFEDIVRMAVKIAKRASNGKALIFGDCGPTGVLPRPMGKGDFDFYYDNYRRIVEVFLDEGVDGIIFETFSDILELKTAVMAVRDLSKDIFLIVHLTFDENGRTLTGSDPMNFAITFGNLDVDVLGINCSLGPEDMLPVFQELSKYHDGFLSVEPNAGNPIIVDGKIIYPESPEDFAKHVDSFWEYGANIIGGCCGSGPDHIKLMRKVLGYRPPNERKVKRIFSITSPSKVVKFDKFVVIGERINPSGRKKLWNKILEKDADFLKKEALEQITSGADVIDVNFGVESSVDWDFAVDLISELPYSCDSPLSLDVQELELLERMMRVYPGNPLINSSTSDERELERKLELLKKYGGMLVVLAMKKNIPKDAKERIEAVMDAIKFAKDNNVDPKERFIFDPVVIPVGVSREAVFEILKTIEWLAREGYRTTLGLSNISFGLPNRSYYHSAFLVLAIERGLSSAIMNPLDNNLMENMRAVLRLIGKLDLPKGRRKPNEDSKILDVILSGKKDELLKIVDELLKNHDPLEVVENHLKPAMEMIGDMYDRGDIFLPQLILSSQTVKPAFKLVETKMKGGKLNLGKFVVATVKGDIHDIGKNIVSAVVKSSGFEVIDLGKDVPSEKIVEVIEKEKPIALGLSAMTTTTAPKIREVSTLMKEKRLNVPIIVGGATLNDKLAKDLGADYYAKNATDVVRILKNILKGLNELHQNNGGRNCTV